MYIVLGINMVMKMYKGCINDIIIYDGFTYQLFIPRGGSVPERVKLKFSVSYGVRSHG